jgi:hypothetical protein
MRRINNATMGLSCRKLLKNCDDGQAKTLETLSFYVSKIFSPAIGKPRPTAMPS